MNLLQINRASGAAISFLLAVGLFAGIALAAKFSVRAPAIDADRAAERAKVHAEISAAEDAALNTGAVIDPQRGIVRLPIETAIQLAVRNWSDAAQARADLAARVEKATATVKPVSFE